MVKVKILQSDSPKIHVVDTSTKVNIHSPTVTITGEVYRGKYVIEPDFEGEILRTKNKTMSDNVTVNPIAVYRTANVGGGTTVIIGGEVEING